MDNLAQELLDELLPSIEALEAQSAAILQFMKDQGVASDEQLAPYLEQAATASNVRWRAARLRLNRVLTVSAEQSAQQSEQPKDQKAKAPAQAEQPESERVESAKDAASEDNEDKKTTEATDSVHKYAREEEAMKETGTKEEDRNEEHKEEEGTKQEVRKSEATQNEGGTEATKQDTPSKREQKYAA